MLTNQSHRIFIALSAVIILLLGVSLGNTMVDNLGGEALDSVKIGLLFTVIILMLLIGTFVLEIKNYLESKKSGKNLESKKSEKKMNVRSQAALEFLTTYGWAFLVILIMMSTLAYFGILSPSKLLPDRCNFGAEIGCNKNTMIVSKVADNTLTMRLTNNFGVGVVVTAAKVTTDVTTAGTCTAQIEQGIDDTINAFSWEADSTITFMADCDGGNRLVNKEKIKFGIEISYYPASAGEDYEKIIFGEVFTTIQ